MDIHSGKPAPHVTESVEYSSCMVNGRTDVGLPPRSSCPEDVNRLELGLFRVDGSINLQKGTVGGDPTVWMKANGDAHTLVS